MLRVLHFDECVKEKNDNHRMTQRHKKKQRRNSKGATVAHSSSHANSVFSDGEADEEETKDVQRKDEPIR